MNSDAENLRRSATAAPLMIAGNRLASSALPWNNGIEQYRTSSGPNATALCDAVRAARPCVICTALGAPVDPDVKIKQYSESADADFARLRRGVAHCGRRSRRDSSVMTTVAVGVGDVAVELGGAVRGVEADDDGAGERGAEQQ